MSSKTYYAAKVRTYKDYSLEKEIERVSAWRAKLEIAYSYLDRQRLDELREYGAITAETANSYLRVMSNMETAYFKYEELKKQQEKLKTTPLT